MIIKKKPNVRTKIAKDNINDPKTSTVIVEDILLILIFVSAWNKFCIKLELIAPVYSQFSLIPLWWRHLFFLNFEF